MAYFAIAPFQDNTRAAMANKTDSGNMHLHRAGERPAPVSDEMLLELYRLMHLGRGLHQHEARIFNMQANMRQHGTCMNRESMQVVIGSSFSSRNDFLFLRQGDVLTAIAAGVTPEEILLMKRMESDAANANDDGSGEYTRRSSASMRVQNLGSCSGSHPSHALGLARAIRYYGGEELVCYVCDAEYFQRGDVVQALRTACRESLPVLFVQPYILNHASSESEFAGVLEHKEAGDRLLVLTYDGEDVFQCWTNMNEAIAHVRSATGPAILIEDAHEAIQQYEEKQQRFDDESAMGAVRPDALLRLRDHLLVHELCDEAQLATIEDENRRKLERVATLAESARIFDTATIFRDAYIDDTHECPVSQRQFERSLDTQTHDASHVTLHDAINRSFHDEFRRNPNTFFLRRKSIASESDACNFVDEMQAEFGHDRVFNTSMTEDFILGSANGLCRYRDDIWVAVEISQATDSLLRAMQEYTRTAVECRNTQADFVPNIVVRFVLCGEASGGGRHSQGVVGVLTAIPGVRIVMPSSADDAAGLLRCAFRTRGMTVFLEESVLHNHAWANAPYPNPDSCVPIGRARLRRDGDALSIIAQGATVPLAMNAADALSRDGVQAEILDLRTLQPFDTEAMSATIRRTGKALIAVETDNTVGFGAEIAAFISGHLFEYLDAPVHCLTVHALSPWGTPSTGEQQLYDAALKLLKY